MTNSTFRIRFKPALLRLLVCTLALPVLVSCAGDSLKPAEEIIPEMIADGFRFTEGPVWDPQRAVLYFSDIPNNRIHTWCRDNGVDLYRDESGGANGLFLSTDGILYSCDGTARRLRAEFPTGRMLTLVESFEGKRLNSPNDLWVDAHGGIYFTDPRYGNRRDMEFDGEFVFYLPPNSDAGSLRVVAADLVRPNGIFGTPDGKSLFIADHGDAKIWRYSIGTDGSLSDKSLFIERGSDGMTMDRSSNLYLTDGNAVVIVSPDGLVLREITMPQKPTNLTFGGHDMRSLFVTAGTAVYELRPGTRGLRP